MNKIALFKRLKRIAVEFTRYAAFAGVLVVVAWWYYCSFIAECRCIDPERAEHIYIPVDSAYMANVHNLRVSAEICAKMNEQRCKKIARTTGKQQETLNNIIVPKNFATDHYLDFFKECLEKAGVTEFSFKFVDEAISTMEDEESLYDKYLSPPTCYRHQYLREQIERMEIITGVRSKEYGYWDWLMHKVHAIFCSSCTLFERDDGMLVDSVSMNYRIGSGYPFILSKDAYTEGVRKSIKFVSVYVCLPDNPAVEKYADAEHDCAPLTEKLLHELLALIRKASQAERLSLPIHIRDTWTGRVRYIITPYGKAIIPIIKLEQSHE